MPGGMERGRLTAMLLWTKQEPLWKLPNANGEKILRGSVHFAFFSVKYYGAASVAGSAGHKVHAFYVEKCLSLDRVGQINVTGVVFEQGLPCKVSWHFMKG